MSSTKAHSHARTILSRVGAAAALALLAGCSTLTVTNLTPSDLQENPSEIYTFTLRATPHTSTVVPGSITPQIVIDGQIYPMKPSALGGDLYEFDYQLPPGRQDVAYYFLVGYKVEGNGIIEEDQTNTGLEHATIIHRYVLTLEAGRGPVGSTIGVLGRGFTPQDQIQFNGTSVQTIYSSPTSLSFIVPSMAPGVYSVTLASPAGNSPVGQFQVDPTSVQVSPSSLTLATGQSQDLTFTIASPAPPGGLLLDVATDVPESVIMPEVRVPEGQTSVTVPVEGGRPGSGTLVLKGYGEGVTVPVTVSGR